MGTPTVIVTVFMFAVWIIALDTRAGVLHVSPSLVEMSRVVRRLAARSGSKMVLLAALPEILAGVRLGVIRGVKGVVIGQLLVSIIGVGALFALYPQNFLMAHFWALIVILFTFALALAELVGAPRETHRILRRSTQLMSDAARRSPSAAYVIEPPAVVALPVQGTDQLFPVNRIFCIGRNYAAHAVEMGHDPDKEPPFFFMKSAANLAPGGEFPYPSRTADVHHEIELIVALDRGGSGIAVGDALGHVYGYAVGLDMTRRDLQGEAKKLGRPWEVGKSFEMSAPCGPLVPAARIGHPDAGAVTLDVNGERRQEGDLNQMIWKVPEMIATLSDYFELQPGDLIMTGTPSGVGAVERGDVMVGRVAGVGEITVKVV